MRKIIIADNQDISKAGWHYFLQNIFEGPDICEVTDKKELIRVLIDSP